MNNYIAVEAPSRAYRFCFTYGFYVLLGIGYF